MREVDGYVLSHWCNYPPEPARTRAYCAVSVSVTGFGPKSEGLPSVMPKKKNTSDWWNGDRTNAVLCAGEVAADAGFDFPKFGIFRMNVVETRQSCWRVDYGPSQPAVITACGAFINNLKEYWSQQWCNGRADTGADLGHDFTMEECKSSSSSVSYGRVVCNRPTVRLDTNGPGVVNGVLDDGARHTAVWRPTTLEGDTLQGVAHPLSTRVVVQRDTEHLSTPFRVGAFQEASNQPFQGVPSVDGKTGDLMTMPGLQFYVASNPDSPWVLNRWTTVQGTFKIRSTRIVSVVLTSDGSHLVTEDYDEFFVDTVECQSAPLTVSVSRAHNVR